MNHTHTPTTSLFILSCHTKNYVILSPFASYSYSILNRFFPYLHSKTLFPPNLRAALHSSTKMQFIFPRPIKFLRRCSSLQILCVGWKYASFDYLKEYGTHFVFLLSVSGKIAYFLADCIGGFIYLSRVLSLPLPLTPV